VARERIALQFVVSAPDLDACPRDDAAEVAVAGRSNAGKSSVLNQIADHRELARTSRTPGRTRLMNFFATTTGGRIVDLPGYGFARASKSQRQAWRVHVERYLSQRRNLVGLVLVMDIRHPLEPFDRQLLAWARLASLPTHVLLNKADKLGHGARTETLRAVKAALATPPDVQHASVQLFSAATGLGREELIARLGEWLHARPDAQ
jgi:GTP-binding protein